MDARGINQTEIRSREFNSENFQYPFPSSSSIVYVIESFPSPTEYFILNEIIELEKRGVRVIILVLRKMKKYKDVPRLNHLTSPVIYLPSVFRYLPLLILALHPFSLVNFPFSSTQLAPYGYIKRIRNYCFSLYFLRKLKNLEVLHIHAHFAFIAADIAQILSKLLGRKYSISAHAQDIFTNNKSLGKKIQSASFTITCTASNQEFLNKLTRNNFHKKIFHVYHGIDHKKWQSVPGIDYSGKHCFHILSVARLVEKKGLLYLLQAIKILKEKNENIKCIIVGEGPMKKQLSTYIKRNNIQKYVEIHPFLKQQDLIQYYSSSDCFVLPCKLATNGDRDGLPNVILEAMIMGVPVITSPTSAITEVVEDKISGNLVKENDEMALANAILELKNNRNLVDKISRNARNKIQRDFKIEDCTDRLIKIFESNIKGES